MKTWTEKEIETLKQYYPILIREEMQRLLPSKTYSSMQRKASQLGVKKTPETLSRICALQTESRAKNQFKKGHTPFNKGKKGIQFSSEAAKERWQKSLFTPEMRRHNEKYDGAIAKRKDNKSGIVYHYIRMERGKWMLLHRHIWEKHHQCKLSRKQNVVFIDGNTENFDISNLKVLTNQELMLHNSVQNYPDSFKSKMYVLNGFKRKLKVKIKKYHEKFS